MPCCWNVVAGPWAHAGPGVLVGGRARGHPEAHGIVAAHGFVAAQSMAADRGSAANHGIATALVIIEPPQHRRSALSPQPMPSSQLIAAHGMGGSRARLRASNLMSSRTAPAIAKGQRLRRGKQTQTAHVIAAFLCDRRIWEYDDPSGSRMGCGGATGCRDTMGCDDAMAWAEMRSFKVRVAVKPKQARGRSGAASGPSCGRSGVGEEG